jgi:acetyl/propionyl-CoA carboxylase alpha subunit
VLKADHRYFIGPAPSSQSYLNADKIVEACLETGAQAVHPGYGFLSERAHFAEKLDKNGIVFIGPKPHALTVRAVRVALCIVSLLQCGPI